MLGASSMKGTPQVAQDHPIIMEHITDAIHWRLVKLSMTNETYY